MKKQLTAVSIIVTLFVGYSACASILEFSFDDPIGDHTGLVDVTGLDFSFDNITGNYEAILTADAANMFRGDFRINLNLFNPDTGTTNWIPSFFTDTMNDYSLTSPTNTIILTGVNPNLTQWEIGDRVATTHLPFGSPDGISTSRSSVANLPWEAWGVSEDIIAEGGYTTITPEPGTVLLFGLGGLILRRRMK